MGEVELSLLRPSAPEDLLDEEAFEHDEFLPYWAELWPAASALAAALPGDLRGVRSRRARAAGSECPRWSQPPEAPKSSRPTGPPTQSTSSRQNAERNGLTLQTRVWDWRDPWEEQFDLALAADVLYELRNVEPLVNALRELAPEALIGLAGRPYEQQFLNRVESTEIAERVVRVRTAGL